MKTRTTMMLCLLTISLAALAQSERTFKVQNFQQIQFNTFGHVYFEQGPTCSVRAKGLKDDLDRLIVKVQGNVLVIDEKKRKKPMAGIKNKVVFYVTAPTLSALTVDGVASFDTKQIDVKSDFRLEVRGVCSTRIEHLKCNGFDADIDGVANNNLNIEARSAHFGIDGVTKGSVDVKSDVLRLDIDGADTMKFTFAGNECRVVCDGVCKGSLHVDCQSLHAQADGLTDMTISGTADKVDFGTDGVAKFNTKDLNRF